MPTDALPTLDTEALWRGFHARVRAYVARRVPDAADADDLVQEVFLRLHQALPSLDHAERAPTWVFGIARRAVADYWRRRYRQPDGAPLAEGLEPADDAPAPDPLALYAGDHDVHEEVLSWLRPMAEALPEPDRTALLLADFEGVAQREVAERMGLSLSGAKSRVQRARQKLAGVLEACCAVEFGPDGRATAFQRLRPREDCPADC